MCSRSLGGRGARSSRTPEKVGLVPNRLAGSGSGGAAVLPACCPFRAAVYLHNSFVPGIIITTHDKLAHYLGMLTHQVPIESQFTAGLVDHLNAEIVLGTVRSVGGNCSVWCL